MDTPNQVPEGLPPEADPSKKPAAIPKKMEKRPSAASLLARQIGELLREPDRTLAIQLALGACYLALKLLCPSKELLATLDRLAAQYDRKSKSGGGQSGNTVRNLRLYATLLGKYARLATTPEESPFLAPSQRLRDLSWLREMAFNIEGLDKKLAEANLTCAAELVRQARTQDKKEPDPALSWYAACSRLRVALLVLPLTDRQPALDLIAELLDTPPANSTDQGTEKAA